MKTLTFKYTKSDNSVSERTLLVMTSPSDAFSGIDVSSLDDNSAAEFLAMASKLNDEYLEMMKALQARFDLKHNFRKFLPAGMSDITEI